METAKLFMRFTKGSLMVVLRGGRGYYLGWIRPRPCDRRSEWSPMATS